VHELVLTPVGWEYEAHRLREQVGMDGKAAVPELEDPVAVQVLDPVEPLLPRRKPEAQVMSQPVWPVVLEAQPDEKTRPVAAGRAQTAGAHEMAVDAASPCEADELHDRDLAIPE